jgi:hypothetical protein
LSILPSARNFLSSIILPAASFTAALTLALPFKPAVNLGVPLLKAKGRPIWPWSLGRTSARPSILYSKGRGPARPPVGGSPSETSSRALSGRPWPYHSQSAAFGRLSSLSSGAAPLFPPARAAAPAPRGP